MTEVIQRPVNAVSSRSEYVARRDGTEIPTTRTYAERLLRSGARLVIDNPTGAPIRPLRKVQS